MSREAQMLTAFDEIRERLQEIHDRWRDRQGHPAWPVMDSITTEIGELLRAIEAAVELDSAEATEDARGRKWLGGHGGPVWRREGQG